MNPRDDDGLEEYLRGASDLSRVYRRTAQHAPPPALDRCVLDRARAARRPSRYRNIAALAAAVLLTLGVLIALAMLPRTIRRADESPRFLQAAVRGGDAAGMHLVYQTLKRAPAAPLRRTPNYGAFTRPTRPSSPRPPPLPANGAAGHQTAPL